MRIACYGYPVAGAGSIAGAMHRLLEQILHLGHNVVFFNKPTFVRPDDLLTKFANLEFEPVVNRITDRLYENVGRRFGAAGHASFGQLNHRVFARAVVAAMRAKHATRRFDLVLYLGTAAFGRVPHVPTISWVQGAPGSDVRSVDRHAGLLRTTEGRLRLAALRGYGLYRMRLGTPDLRSSDRLVVGSSTSREALLQQFGLDPHMVISLPYPLDFSAYHPLKQVSPLGPLRVLWLGRIVPRKRLDLLLDGALRALQRGVDLRLDIIGGVGFAQGLASLIGRFPRPDVLQHVENVPHARVGAVLAQADVLAQPSEEEDFGSSVAEAMACGTPALLGPTNGMRDYACPKSIVLERGSPDAVADALTELAHRKKAGTLRNATVSRCWAERWFDPKGIATRFLQECAAVVAERNKTVHRANGDLAG